MTEWDAAVAAMTDVVVADLQAALAEAEAARERVYYDTDADTTARQAYYAGLDPETPDPAGVRQLLTATHTTQPRYKPAVEVYPWVDLHPDGLLRSLYTGESYTPADLIQADVSVVQARVEGRARTAGSNPCTAKAPPPARSCTSPCGTPT